MVTGRHQRHKPERPTLPRGRLPNAYAAPSLHLWAAASRHKLDPQYLYRAAEAAQLPPWTAAKPGRLPRLNTAPEETRWRFAAAAALDEISNHIHSDHLWLHRIHHDDSDLTAAWVKAPDTPNIDITQIAEWCRCAPSHSGPLQADRGMFALWCADHPHAATFTAHRHVTLLRWFEMLRQEGIADVAETHPAEGTSIEAVAAPLGSTSRPVLFDRLTPQP